MTTTPTDDAVRYAVDQQTCTITLSRPDRRNAVDGPTAAALRDAFLRFEGDTSARVAILTGARGHFCAGADLTSVGNPARRHELDPEGGGTGPMGPTRMRLSKPLIAAVNGYAVAGAILRPDRADNPIWMNDPNFKLLAQYKQFVFSFQHTILDRVVHEAKLGHYRPAMALAGYVPIMLAADLARGMIQGGGALPGYQQDWGPADFLGDAVSRAGLYGTSQFDVGSLLDAKHMGDVIGPTASQGIDWFDAARGKGSVGDAAFKSLPAYPAYRWAGPHAAPHAGTPSA